MHRWCHCPIGLALASVAAGGLWAQTFPPTPIFDEIFELPQVSGEFNPMRVSVESVIWDGSGPVSIPFSLNQRGTVWLAVYEKENNELGVTGPGGAWLRLVEQDKLVEVTSGQVFNAGSNALIWSARDWRGNKLSPGEYEFDLIAVNNLDKAVLAGPSSRLGFGSNIIDTRHDPPEVWIQEYDRRADSWGRHRAGDVIRGVLGTDYLSRPNDWQRWDYNQEVFNFDDARTLGGLRVDDRDPEVFWTTHHAGPNGGIYKMRIDRSFRSWSRVTSFGDNGFAPNKEDRIAAIEPWQDLIYAAHWGRGSVPACTVEAWDKETGDLTSEFDLTEFFVYIFSDGAGNQVALSRGPSHLTVNAHGIWVNSWGIPNLAHLDHDGRVIWVNRNGDTLGDHVSNEEAVRLGMAQGATGNNLQIQADASGHAAFVTTYKNNRGSHFSVFGRDGAGLFEVFMSGHLGPFRNDTTWYITIVDEDGGQFDGIYYGTHLSLTAHNFEFVIGRKFGPGMLLYIPYELQSGSITRQGTAVEAAEKTGSPDDCGLGPAYPNPFNGETTVEFVVGNAGGQRVRLEIYNAAGQLMTTLVDASLHPGTYQAKWNGRDGRGDLVGSGIYFCRMRTGSFAAVRAITVLR